MRHWRVAAWSMLYAGVVILWMEERGLEEKRLAALETRRLAERFAKGGFFPVYGLSITTATERDMCACLAIANQPPGLAPLGEWSTDDWKEIMSDGNVYVARDAFATVIGFISAERSGKEGWIRWLAVDHAYRQCGVGGALLDFALTRLLRDGCSKVGAFASEMGRAVFVSRAFQIKKSPYVYCEYKP